MNFFDWLLNNREGGPAPVVEAVPSWTAPDFKPSGKSPLSKKAQLDQQQRIADELRAQSQQGGQSQMIPGGGGSPGFGSLPSIYVPGNNLGTALAQGVQGYMAGRQQRGVDTERAAWEEEMRRAAEEAAREYASTVGGASANPTGGAAPASALPLSTAPRGGSDSLAERQAMQQVYGDFQDTTDSMQPAPVEPATGLSGEGITIPMEDLQSNTPGGFQPMSENMGTPAAPQGDPRFMAAFKMAMNPLSQDIGMSMMRQATGGGNDPTAQMKNLMFYNSLPKEQQPMFMNMVRDQNLNLGSGFLNQASGQFIPKGFTPEGWASVRSKAIDDNSSDQKVSAFLAAAGGDQRRAYQMQQQAIEQQLMETVSRATGQPNPGQAPMRQSAPQSAPQAAPPALGPQPSALPQAAGGEVQGMDATEAEMAIAMRMRDEGKSDAEIAQYLTSYARSREGASPPPRTALPQAVAANAPLASAPSSGVLVGPDTMAANKKLAEGRAAREVELENNYAADTANIESARNNTQMLDKMLEDAAKKTTALSAGFIGDVTKGVGGTPAADLAADIESITSGLAFQKLQELKSLSSTGASGLGQLAIKEFEALSTVLGSLKTSQSPDQLRAKIETVRSHLKVVQDLVEKAHAQKYAPMQGADSKPRSTQPRYRLKSLELNPKLKSSYEEY